MSSAGLTGPLPLNGRCLCSAPVHDDADERFAGSWQWSAAALGGKTGGSVQIAIVPLGEHTATASQTQPRASAAGLTDACRSTDAVVDHLTVPEPSATVARHAVDMRGDFP